MLLFWHIRYLDSCDKMFKDRNLWIDTETLDAVDKAAIELTRLERELGASRDMLRFRHLFHTEALAPGELTALCERAGEVAFFSISDYFEDENCTELTLKQIAVIQTGNPDAVCFPPGMKQHDIQYVLADRCPIAIDHISLSTADLDILGYFSRDLRELINIAFYREGPGKLVGDGSGILKLQTAVTDDEIRSFITVFRRLYMQREPAGFLKAVSVFCRAVTGHPMSAWVNGVAGEYATQLDSHPSTFPLAGPTPLPFDAKRLIDVFLYTKYFHQPDQQRIRQYQECLAAVGNREPLLTYFFLMEIWSCSMHIRNAGTIIARFFDWYCRMRNLNPAVIAPIAAANPEIGSLEKKVARRERLFREKVDDLAIAMWTKGGCPQGGHLQFLETAAEQLSHAIGKTGAS